MTSLVERFPSTLGVEIVLMTYQVEGKIAATDETGLAMTDKVITFCWLLLDELWGYLFFQFVIFPNWVDN